MTTSSILNENPALARTLQAEIVGLHVSSIVRDFVFKTICECLRHTEFTRPPLGGDLIEAISVIRRLAPFDELATALSIDMACLRLRTRMAVREIERGPKEYWRATVVDVEICVGRRLHQFFPWLSFPDQRLASFAKVAMDELQMLNDMIIEALYSDKVGGCRE